MGLENLTKSELIELFEKEQSEKEITQSLMKNMNTLLEKLNSGNFGVGTSATVQNKEDRIPLMWCSMGMLPVEIPNRQTGRIITTFDKTWEVRYIPSSDVEHLVNAYRKVFKDGKLIFVNKEDAQRYNMDEVEAMDESKILDMLELPKSKLIEKVRDLTETMQRTFLMHCAKQVKYENDDFMNYAYNKISPLWEKVGGIPMEDVIAQLTFTDVDYDGSDLK